jgi:hypothetical protein
VLPELNKLGIAALGMKPLNGHGKAIKNGVITAQEALRYAMSLPVATTITERCIRIHPPFWKHPISHHSNVLANRCAEIAGGYP